jgi:hypothetical protein
MSKLRTALIVLWFLLVSASPAQAYLDPGAGSMMLQVVLGGSAAFLVILKLCWQRLLALIGMQRKQGEPEASSPP